MEFSTKKMQLLYYFTEYGIENGFDVDRKKNALKTLNMFIDEWKENLEDEVFDRDELPMFAESLEELESARNYLLKIMEV